MVGADKTKRACGLLEALKSRQDRRRDLTRWSRVLSVFPLPESRSGKDNVFPCLGAPKAQHDPFLAAANASIARQKLEVLP